jgi:conflict system pore-forming effector with SLATT domain
MDFPSSRAPFSASSRITKSRYECLVLAEVVLTVGIAALAVAIGIVQSPEVTRDGLAVVLFLFIGSFLIRVYSTSAQLDQKWYSYRAVAESVKTLSWQYAMGTGEFPIESNVADQSLRKRVSEVEGHARYQPLPETLSLGTNATIPHSMSELRTKSWEQRRVAYLDGRVEDQIAWYLREGNRTTNLSNWFSRGVIAVQLAGVVLAIAILTQQASGSTGVALVALLAVLISSLIAWTQAKQYSELVGPYLSTHRELLQLREEIDLATSEGQFLDGVDHTELAVSREHTSWLAMRGVNASPRTR